MNLQKYIHLCGNECKSFCKHAHGIYVYICRNILLLNEFINKLMGVLQTKSFFFLSWNINCVIDMLISAFQQKLSKWLQDNWLFLKKQNYETLIVSPSWGCMNIFRVHLSIFHFFKNNFFIPNAWSQYF